MKYKIGDLILAQDELGIIDNCIGKIKSINNTNKGHKIYTVEFEDGTFLLPKEQLGDLNDYLRSNK